MPPELTLEDFEAAYRAFQAALNRRDLAEAFAPLAPDCEFHPIEEFLGHRLLVGPDQIRRYWEDAFELVEDWTIEAKRFLRAGEKRFLVLEHGHGTGTQSGVPIELSYSTMVEWQGATVVGVRQFSTWEQGVRAAGLDPALLNERAP